ncbi:hypothetical protein CANARDRAFT_30172 [[Candida] arabinofermentans NRRL YB-2248]|uniref:UDP-galactose transporter homolog 1 n=1 Tax=[Candida] arabinofermentans NRRL YB-2248 TaxID=983967 RepID=A0A1E4SUQ1_9ASCO|nr:hypothetical protein CANARDRAFT_30172 [[Candida] arabinofermentans NRRL YB-2248]
MPVEDTITETKPDTKNDTATVTHPVTDTSNDKSSTILLIICVLGIYSSFLSWSYLQEKISTKNYSIQENEIEYFKAPLIINIIQSIFAIIIGSLYLSIKQKKFETPIQFLKSDFTLLKHFILISLTQSISSPISYQSLNHVNYLFFLLAKSCKLIPVMLIHYLIYNSKFPIFKYVVAIIITVGVLTFTISSSSQKKAKNNDGQTVLGLTYLIISLFLDGLTNSTQDQLFKDKSFKNYITGGHLMSGLNLLNCIFTTLYAMLFTNQIQYFLNFITKNGLDLFYDILLFGLFGSLGQIFIFLTLEKFNSIVLVTVTVTRKMISMCLSVFLFGHSLNLNQWFGLLLVFAGIFLESFSKMFQKKKKVL